MIGYNVVPRESREQPIQILDMFNIHTLQSQDLEEKGGSLLVVSIPLNAQVILDGQLIQKGEEPITTPVLMTNIPAGRHNLILTLPGFIDQSICIGIEEGGYIKTTVEMCHKTLYQQTVSQQTTVQQTATYIEYINAKENKTIKDQIESMQMGSIIAVSFPPGASVFIDGVPIVEQHTSTTPLIVRDVPAGPHTVTFRLIGYFDELVSTNLPKGGYMEISARLRPI